VGPPVARSAANPWAPALENSKRDRPTRAERVAARVLPELDPCKSLSECCEARAGRRPERAPSQGWWLVGPWVQRMPRGAARPELSP
jgi:hypothetical protein